MAEERSLESLLKDTPQEKLDWLVSTSDISEVARRLSKWRRLAPHLHITLQQEEEIVNSHPSDLELQTLKCLQKWSHNQYFKATYRALIQAVYKVEDLNLIDEICKLLKTKSCPSPPPQTILGQYAQELRECYSDLLPPPIFQALAGDDQEGPSPSEKFINLVMTSRERVQRGGVDDQHMRMALEGNVPGMTDYMSERMLKVPVKLQDIFTLDSKERKVILIEGAPGSGKTTLFWHTCQRWSAPEEKLFPEFSLILLVKLRDPEVQKAKHLADILPFTDEKEEIASEIMQMKGKGVLLLLDGWDELPEEQQRDSLFQTLIEAPHKHSLQKAAVLVSARQISSANLHLYISTRIEILGFTPDQIEEYVETSLQSQPQAATSLLTTIKQDPVLQGNCYLPLSIAIITHTFICMGHALPATFCRIIEELALSCLFRHVKKHTPYGHLYRTLNSFDDLQSEMQSQFNTLCEKAYNSLLLSEYCFSEQDTPTLGLMQSVQSFVVRGKKTQHYFLHKSLHELCAAKHFLAKETEEKQSSVVEDILMGKISQMTSMLLFYSAFGGWEQTQTKQILSKHVQKFHMESGGFHHFTKWMHHNEQMRTTIGIDKWKQVNPDLMVLCSLYESQKPELCQILPPSFRIVLLPLTTRDCIALRYIISHKKLEQLQVRGMLQCDLFRIMAPALKLNMPKELQMIHTNIQDEGITMIAEAIYGTSIMELTVSDCGMTEAGAEVLSSALCSSQIKYLSVSRNKIGDAGITHIASNLTNTVIQQLGLDDCGIGDEGIIILSRTLHMTKIAYLNLSGNHISTRGLKALAGSIMKTPFLMTLQVRNNIIPTIETEGIKQLLITLTYHPTFMLLGLCDRDRSELSDTIRIVNQARKALGHWEIEILSRFERRQN